MRKMLSAWGSSWGDGPRHSQILEKVIDPKGVQNPQVLFNLAYGAYKRFQTHAYNHWGSSAFCSVCLPLFL